MDKIIENIKDPAWWFSAFFIAIIASIVAGFAKDRIERFAGKFLSLNKQRQTARAEQHAKVVNALAEHEGFMILSMIRSIGQMLLTVSMFILFLLSPMLVELNNSWCNALPIDPTCSENNKYMSFLASASFGILSILCGYVSSARLRLTTLGYNEYRKRRGLPVIEY